MTTSSNPTLKLLDIVRVVADPRVPNEGDVGRLYAVLRIRLHSDESFSYEVATVDGNEEFPGGVYSPELLVATGAQANANDFAIELPEGFRVREVVRVSDDYDDPDFAGQDVEVTDGYNDEDTGEAIIEVLLEHDPDAHDPLEEWFSHTLEDIPAKWLTKTGERVPAGELGREEEIVEVSADGTETVVDRFTVIAELDPDF